MRLIDADALIATMENVCSASNNVKQRRIEDLVLHGIVPQIIDDAPTIEAAPVKHGWWEYSRCDKDGRMIYKCTECGCTLSVEPEMKFALSNDKYCYNCGAKMDGDGDE